MKISNVNLEAVQGDIIKQSDIDAIVNAANAELQIGTGVAGAIHTAAGPELAEECEKLAPIKTGQAVITKAYDLPNQYIIHTLGPIYGFSQPEVEFLTNCYQNALKLAEENNIKSIAFPAISTGAFGFPFDEASKIALKACTEYIHKLKSLDLIRFVLFSEQDYKDFQKQLDNL